jgi:ribosomal protein L16/L10AE
LSLVKCKNKIRSTLQKNRIKRRHVKKNLVFGYSGLLLYRQTIIENVHFKYIRLLLKRRRRRSHKIRLVQQQYWVRFGKNVQFSKKSKNSRMGSGKGKYLRKATVIGKNKTILEFRYYRVEFLYRLKQIISYKYKMVTKVMLTSIIRY